MLHLFTPHVRVESVWDLTPDRLGKLEIDGLLLDVDCTLKRYHQNDVQTEVVAWLSALRTGGIGCCIVSNGWNDRIGQFAEIIGLPFVSNALKPLPCGINIALAKMGFKPDRTAIVGDQIFTDVLAGRLAGIKCILVRPIHPEEEPWFTRIKRPPERLLLHWMERGGKG
jgi:uncharacterized protein